MSDRSFRRAAQVRWLWRRLAGGVTAFYAQGAETAGRLRTLGARGVRVLGNLKYDLPATSLHSTWAGDLAVGVRGRPLVVAGSTLPGEEAALLAAWPAVLEAKPDAVLLVAPRHPQRFREVEALLRDSGHPLLVLSREEAPLLQPGDGHLLLLDSLGQLADVYQLARVAFVGGSLVPRGGHNPLEAARFGVPVVMGPSYENFREVVDGLRAADAIRIVTAEGLADALTALLAGDGGLGARGRSFYEAQSGATARTVAALRGLLRA